MTKTQGWLVVVLLLIATALLSVTAANSIRPKAPEVEWEYQLAMMGSLGWELTFARRALSGEGSSQHGIYECIFKRPKRDAGLKPSPSATP
jgi:hypothetical protein